MDFGEADTTGENANVVRVMTIHKSKGLEFPVVFVSGLGRKMNQMDASDRSIYERLKDNRATTAEIKKSLSFLTRIMAQYYHKPVILLLDEYDVPIAKADSKGYYDQMLEIISPLLGTALKDNEFLKFAVITGCLRITKESIFTGTNNFITDTISDNRYNEFFGFTQPEVTKLLTDTHCEACAAVIQKWYDGYHFGNLDIYCPWDVLNYIQKVMATGTQEPENFWEHTSCLLYTSPSPRDA